MGRTVADYSTVVHQLHRALFNANVGTDFIFPETLAANADLSQYKLIVIPPLYIADDAQSRFDLGTTTIAVS